ncbi:DEAD/DEAH box helicase [Frankia sp. AgB1.9]|uniref:helicase-related protein n=1 Tax=unclassified Frankia TaxID=2632575 RepID=UPI0019328CA8|nr:MULTISPECIES: helicase-related protein [unclassified Frankia]MBL7492507.1 DEAD/DEAH box helicase [Frankia sp. AgW1.1]MBL7547582.1 DEAD/DEAH box helicase [Frankia sp. AgB1.9]MBL7619503.1 DEAD/DEAH box helicase [Frankia sp. AgB1.8]
MTATDTTTGPTPASFAVGSLVRTRGREWVVLPGATAGLLLLRPLGGAQDEVAGVLPALERVESATFPPPAADDLGDATSARLLRSALRLGFRSSGGPFRSLAGLAVTPRSYQLVPLLMALRMDTVRLLIADGVGIGKTIEAGLIVAELLAQGGATRFTVLCSPALAQQWHDELAKKFGLQTTLVLASTAGRLERDLPPGESLFEHHLYTIVSTDFIKSSRRRDEFLRACPDLVIVDEAHTCVAADDSTSATGRATQQRQALLTGLAADHERHLLLLTATPHSGKAAAFRALLSLLDPSLANLPEDLSGDTRRRERERIARHLVQRQRADIRAYLDETTSFPDRQTTEESYQLSPAYRDLFADVLTFARDSVTDASGGKVAQRVRWWSVLALLRSLASSPAAAVETLRNRSGIADAEDVADADARGEATVLDLTDAASVDGADTSPGAQLDPSKRRLAAMATIAEKLYGPKSDAKLAGGIQIVKQLLDGGDAVVVFCRYISTAAYLADALRAAKGFADVQVAAVTGQQPPDDRAATVADLAERTAGSTRRVLVATDCLSEGINLHQHFSAVVHYDLSWNPTRHEQREGRVDRFGQTAPVVHAVTYFGADNPIDRLVLDVLLRRHNAIRKDTGVSVPVPADSEVVLSAVLEGLVAATAPSGQLELEGIGAAARADLLNRWVSAAEREKRSRSLYAQEQVRPEEVGREVAEIRASLGGPDEVRGFTLDTLASLRSPAHQLGDGRYHVVTAGLPPTLRDQIGREILEARRGRGGGRFAASSRVDDFCLAPALPAAPGEVVLTRTDPTVETLARYVLDTALDQVGVDEQDRPARRCGVMVTDAVDTRTVLLLLRYRLHLTLPGRAGLRPLVAEEARVLAFTGTPATPSWLDEPQVAAQLAARPVANYPRDVAVADLHRMIGRLDGLTGHLDDVGDELAAALLASHRRVREAAGSTGNLVRRGLSVKAQRPADILGVYLHLPAARP